MEVQTIQQEAPGLLDTGYHVARIFDVSPQLEAYGALPGLGYLQYDRTFTVFGKGPQAPK